MSEITYDLQGQLEMAVRNPQGLQRVAIDYMQAKLGGATIPDPISPVVQLLEVGSTQTALAMQEALSLDRRRYALLANNTEDLYCSMSDADYLDRFSGPATVPLYALAAYDDILNGMVTDTSTGVRRLIIPRYSVFNVNTNYQFTLLYPLEIRLLTSGELQVVYNTDQLSPLQELTDNTIEWSLIRMADRKQYLRIQFEMNQVARDSETFSLNAGATLSHTMVYSDLYYYARVWTIAVDGTQTELRTTHAEIQHDTRVPTAYLQVDTDAQSLQVSIPPIYLSNKLVSNQIRIDLYTCKGELEIPLAATTSDQYSWDFGVDADNSALTRYSAGWSVIPMQVWSDGFIWGGHGELSFEQLRDRVIYRRATVDTPIMPSQVGAQVSLNGYTVTLGRDDLAGRIFYASRVSPNNPDSRFPTPIPSGIGTVQTTLSSLSVLPGTFDNGDRVTMTPKTLMRITDGVVSLLDSSQYPNVLAANQDDLLSMLNAGGYAYTPFNYVVDTADSNLALRAYYLDNQKLMGRQFLEENESTQLSIQSKGIGLTRTAKGWQLTITTQPSGNYSDIAQEDVHVQLAFVPAGETAMAYQNGTLLKVDAGVWYWQWNLEGNLDFDADDNTYFDNWFIFDTTARTLGASLTQTFKLIHSVSNYSVTGMTAADFDSSIGKFLLPNGVVGVQLEELTLRFGTAMTDLWRGARTVTGAQSFATYTDDVYAYYPDDVYVVYGDTGLDFKVVDGEIVRELEHAKGDPILDANGKQVIQYPKGSVKYVNGLPVVTTNRTSTCVLDLFLMSGMYYYATAARDLTDAAYLPARLADTYLPTVADIIPRKFENTNIYFYPQRNMSAINLITDDNQSVILESGLTVKGTVWLTEAAKNSDSYQAAVRQIITNVLTDKLQAETVSMFEILAAIRDTVDTGVRGVKLQLFAGDKELDTFSSGDATQRTTIRRLLTVQDDGTIGVTLDMTLLWDTLTPPSEALYTTTAAGRTYTSN